MNEFPVVLYLSIVIPGAAGAMNTLTIGCKSESDAHKVIEQFPMWNWTLYIEDSHG